MFAIVLVVVGLSGEIVPNWIDKECMVSTEVTCVDSIRLID